MSEPFQGWENGGPPRSWERLLSFDVGGASPNAMEFAARCPQSSCIVFYDEIHITTTSMRKVAELALPKMKPEGSQEEYNFIFKVGDYENKVALDDMAKYGIRFTNAVKQNKITSVHRLAGYMHPNDKRPFPSWHPRAGELGSPLMFTTPACKHLNEEIPLQKWKNDGKGDSVKDELDRSVKHDALDCALYIARVLPAPALIAIAAVETKEDSMSMQSRMYYQAVKDNEERKNNTESRRPYNASHTNGSGGVNPAWLQQLSHLL